MAKGPLRLAIEDFIFSNFEPTGGGGWWDRVKARFQAYYKELNEYEAKTPDLPFQVTFALHMQGAYYSLFGNQGAIDHVTKLNAGTWKNDVSTEIAKKLQELFSNPVTNEVAETLGAIITEPVLTMFEKYAGNDTTDPKEFARAFHGFMIALNLTGGISSTVIEAVSAGAIKGAGKVLDQMYWSLGLGFLGWQTLAPLLSSGLQPGLERYYKKLYRPNRFSASELRDLYALGEISPQQMQDEARFLGWRDGDIDKWLKLAFRTLPEGDIWDALHQGFISQDQAVERLRVIGYDPKDLDLLFKLNPKPETSEAKSFTVANARKAFRDRLISEAELREILGGLKYQTREIDLIIALDQQSQQADDKLLSTSQIRDAWTNNVLTDQEAVHWLGEYGYNSTQINILLATWKDQITPTFRKLNAGTIEGAYVEGILNRTQAKDRLLKVGFSSEDADLELDLTEAKNPEDFGRPLPAKSKTITAGSLADLVSVGLITSQNMRDRLVALGYTEADAAILAEAARIRALPAAKLLPLRAIQDAFFAGVLDRPTATGRLLEIGYSERDAATVLDTVQAELDQIRENKELQQIKRLGAGSLQDLLIAGLISPEEMNTRLISQGFSPLDANLLVSRASELAVAPPRLLNQGNIERAYVVGVLTRDQARDKLLALDFTPEDTETILASVEAANPSVFNPSLVQVTRLPSIGALVAALQNGIITQDEYMGRANEIGYRPEDAQLYLAIATRNVKRSTKELTTSQVTNAYGAGFLPYSEAFRRLTQSGYGDGDATLILRMEKDLIENTDAWRSLLSGAIDPFEAIAQLINSSYSDQDILGAFSGLGPLTLSQMGIDIAQLSEALASTPGGQ